MRAKMAAGKTGFGERNPAGGYTAREVPSIFAAGFTCATDEPPQLSINDKTRDGKNLSTILYEASKNPGFSSTTELAGAPARLP